MKILERNERQKERRSAPSSFDNLKSPFGTYMIILNPTKVNKNKFEDILNKYREMINLPYLECPYCHSSKQIKWGSYERNINYIENKQLIYDVVKIQRVKCKECGHTHALLPSYIIPYKTNLLDVILTGIVHDRITQNFSFDTIEKWKKQFRKFLPYLKTMYKNISEKEIIQKLKENIFCDYEQFYKRFKKVLMMMRVGKMNMAPF